MKNVTLTLEDFGAIVGYSANVYKHAKAEEHCDEILNRVLEENTITFEEWVDALLVTVKDQILKKYKLNA